MRFNLSLKQLFVPIYFEMMLRLATVFINTYMISLIDVNLVGALGAGNQVFSLFITIYSFLAVGCSVVVAQAIGSNNKKLAVRAIHTSISFNALIGAFSGIIVFIFAKDMLVILDVPSGIIQESYHYLRVIAFTFFIDAVAIVLAAIIRVYNHATLMTIVSVFMNIITICINYFVLFEPFGMKYYGLTGVGISTAIGRIIGIVIIFICLIYIVKIKVIPKFFIKFKRDVLFKILTIGIPSAGENLLWMLQYIVAFKFVASMGEHSLSVQTIYFQISSFIFFAGSAMSIANEIIVGKLVGAKRFEAAYIRSIKTLKMGIFITICFVILVFMLKNGIMNILNLNQELKNIMEPLFILTLFLEPARTLNIVMVNSLRAAGDARFPFFAGIIFMWGVSIPLGYFLGIYLGIGILGVWFGFFADEILRGFANTLRWKSRKWQNKALV